MVNNTTVSHPKINIARRFSGAAKTYVQASFLEQEIGQRLFSRLDLFKLAPKTILDLGGGTGLFAQQLSKRFPDAKIINLDLAEGMLKHSSPANNIQKLCADAEQLPLRSNSIDFIFSNCVFHWCMDLRILFKEIHRALKPEGLFLFSTLGPDTLKELRHCLSLIHYYPEYINNFIDMHVLGDLLLEAKFSDPVMDVDNLTITYAHLQSALDDLKQNGSSYTFQKNLIGLTPKSFFSELSSHYESFKTTTGEYQVTFEVTYGHALGSITEQKNRHTRNEPHSYALEVK